MRVLVTGSSGTLGTGLVAELRARGHTVWGTDLFHSSDPQFVRADVGEYRQLVAAFREAQPDVIYHLAAEFGRHNGELFGEQLWRTAMVGTRNVMELCRREDAKLLFASSSEVYGDLEDPVLTENLTERRVIFHPNEYALSKWTNERQILSFQLRHGLDATVLRFFNVYGPGEPPHPYRSVVALFCHRALTGQALPVYEGYFRTFMHVDDFTPTLANVCEADLRFPVYNIGGRDYRSVEELAQIVLDAHGSGTIDLIPTDKHNVRSKRPDIERARSDLDHDPSIVLEEGVPETLAWLDERRARQLA